MQEIVLKYLFTVLFIIVIALSFIKGFNSGFMKEVLSFGTLIVTILLTRIFTPTVANIVKDVTNLESTLTTIIYDALMKNNFYDKLNVPMLENAANTGNIQEAIRDGLCTSIANTIINLICAIAVFIFAFILIKVILKVLDIIDYIPVVGRLNKLLGGVLGIVEAIIIIWVIFILVRALENIPQLNVAIDIIKEAPLVGLLYKNNLVYSFLASLFSNVGNKAG